MPLRRSNMGFLSGPMGSKAVLETNLCLAYGDLSKVIPAGYHFFLGISIQLSDSESKSTLYLNSGDSFGTIVFIAAVYQPAQESSLPSHFVCMDNDQFKTHILLTGSADGASSASSTSGASGASGASGGSGASASGASGASNASAASGASDASGASGASSASGANVASGATSASGASGANVVSGVSTARPHPPSESFGIYETQAFLKEIKDLDQISLYPDSDGFGKGARCLVAMLGANLTSKDGVLKTKHLLGALPAEQPPTAPLEVDPEEDKNSDSDSDSDSTLKKGKGVVEDKRSSLRSGGANNIYYAVGGKIPLGKIPMKGANKPDNTDKSNVPAGGSAAKGKRNNGNPKGPKVNGRGGCRGGRGGRGGEEPPRDPASMQLQQLRAQISQNQRSQLAAQTQHQQELQQLQQQVQQQKQLQANMQQQPQRDRVAAKPEVVTVQLEVDTFAQRDEARKDAKKDFEATGHFFLDYIAKAKTIMFDTPSSKPVESQPIMASAEHLRAEAPKLVPLAAATIASEEALQTATTGTPKNLSHAWSILCEEKQIDDGAPVIDTLVELGVRSERDLDELDEADINNISEKLRKIQRKKFLRFLGIATD